MDAEGEQSRLAALIERATREPGSVPYSADELEAALAWLEAVSEDIDADSDRDAYPQWLAMRARELGGAWCAAIGSHDNGFPTWDEPERMAWGWIRQHASYPFPVGRKCPELQPGMPAEVLRALMPLEGVEYAAKVESAGTRGGALLFMCQPVERRFLAGRKWISRQQAWMPDGGRVEVVPVPRRSIPKAQQADARRWWRAANGLPSGAGRHPGADYWTAARIVDALVCYVREHGCAPANRRDFVQWAIEQATPVDKRPDGGFDDWVAAALGTRWGKRLGMPFDTLTGEIAGESATVWTTESEIASES